MVNNPENTQAEEDYVMVTPDESDNVEPETKSRSESYVFVDDRNEEEEEEEEEGDDFEDDEEEDDEEDEEDEEEEEDEESDGNEELSEHHLMGLPAPGNTMQTSPSPAPDENLEATNFEAMQAKYLPNLEDLEPLAESTFTWEISDWSSLGKKVYSPRFECGGLQWSLLLFPQGNKKPNTVSVYLKARKPRKLNADEPSLTSDASNPGQLKRDATTLTDTEESMDEDAESADGEDSTWYACAQFAIVQWNKSNPKLFHAMTAKHRFDRHVPDWGFVSFQDLARLPTLNGHTVLDGNTTCFTVYVQVVKDPTGVLWHHFTNYDSKQATGYVGIKNQGATCYLNSLIQSLYFTKCFRKAVYQIPTEKDELGSSVPLALQRLFYHLQMSRYPVDTSELTKSFGWDTGDAFTQHDVQELNRVLMDNLEGKMKGTKVEGILTDFFVGQMKSYIKCVNVDFESSRSEDYWDIQLNVKGMKTLEDSFKDYIQVEMLEGENQYDATGFGLQDARKGVVFQSFPPILHLQLKRYEYDFMRDLMVKINDRYEYPAEIDLSPYLDESSDKTKCWKYHLYGVLVHSGDLNAGHYYALIRPEANGNWYKFDDDKVTRATDKEVFEDNFGADASELKNQSYTRANRGFFNRFNIKRHTSAYMLVYLREDSVEKILSPVTERDIPAHIPRMLEEEAREYERYKKEREESHLYMMIDVYTKEIFQHHEGFDLGPDERYSHNRSIRELTVTKETRPISFKVHKATPFNTFVNTVAETLRKPVEDIRLWILIARKNKTIRPEKPIPSGTTKSVEEVREMLFHQHDGLALWVEEPLPKLKVQSSISAMSLLKDFKNKLSNHESGRAVSLFHHNNGKWIVPEFESTFTLIFLKYFDPLTQSLRGITHWVVTKQTRLHELHPIIREIMGWPSTVGIELFEEIAPGNVELLQSKLTFADAEIIPGDIICFQRVLTEEEKKSVDGYVDARQFYDFVCNRITLKLQEKSQFDLEYENNSHHTGSIIISHDKSGDKSEDEKTSKSEFDLLINEFATYEELAKKVGRKLKVEPSNLRFYATFVPGAPSAPVKPTANTTVHTMLYNSYNGPQLLLYEVLEIPLAEYELMKTVPAVYFPKSLTEENEPYDVLLYKNTHIKHVLEAIPSISNQDIESQSLIVWAVQAHRVFKQFTYDAPISYIPEFSDLYIEKMSDDFKKYYEITSGSDSATPEPAGEQSPAAKCISVFHYHKEPNRVHSVPFLFPLFRDETLTEVKQRLGRQLNLPDKEMEKVQLVLFQSSNLAGNHILLDDDEDSVFSLATATSVLGLNHLDKSSHKKVQRKRIIYRNV